MKKLLSLILVFVLIGSSILVYESCGNSNNIDLEQYKSQIETLKEEKELLIDKKNAEISLLNNEIKKLEDEVKNHKDNIERLEGESQRLEDEIKRLEDEIKRLEDEIKRLEDEIKTIYSSFDHDSAELIKQIHTLTQEITDLKGTISTLENEVKELQTTISALENEVKELQTIISTLENDNACLKNENAQLKDEKQALLNCIAGNHLYVDGVCYTCGSKQNVPLYVRDGEYIFFGEYPQSLKEDDINITEVRDSRGYYLGSDGNFYAKIEAKKCSALSNVYFLNGEKLVKKETYYFKVEPIKWRIAKTESGSALIVCESILFSMAYQSNCTEIEGEHFISNDKAPGGTYANNYQYSDLRAWLNGEFYQTAFNSMQKESIPSSVVMNNSESTTIPNNPYADADNAYTYDKIFAPSRFDISNNDYGFSSDEDRMMITSDYAIACGAYSFSETGMGVWWSRSPCSCSSDFVLGVSNTGYIGNEEHYNHGLAPLDYIGVVPALWIKL